MTDPCIAAAFYKFVALPDFRALRDAVLERCHDAAVGGTILLAHEGINGTIAGRTEAVRAVLDWLRRDTRLADLAHKESPAATAPFHRMKVRLKREIVSLGVDDIDPVGEVGTYVAAQDWNALIAQPDVAVIDVRNDYEVAIGSFDGAIDPGTRHFRDFPDWLRNTPALHGKRRLAMFCTGGIRCEKATALARKHGYDEVYHLHGGILKYLETVPENESRWRGECFVFDERVAVGHGLRAGTHGLCRSCRMPIGTTDLASPLYVEGVSCPHCHDNRSEKQKRGYAERQRQVDLARQRGQRHVGARLDGSTEPSRRDRS